MVLFPNPRLWLRAELVDLCKRLDVRIRSGSNRETMCIKLDRTLRDTQLKRGDWKISELVTICVSIGHHDLLRRNLSVPPAAAICSGLNDRIAGVTSSTSECLVCFERFPSNERLETHCGHLVDFCAMCMEDFLASQLRHNEPTGIKCPADACEEKLAPEDVEGYLPFDVVCHFKMQYIALLCGGFICPTENCGTAISENDQLSFVKCGGCRHRVCITCRSEWHSGITCEQFQIDLVRKGEEQAKEDERIAEEAEAEERAREEEQRLVREADERLQAQRREDENASTQYKETKTRPCPRCSVPIEKNGGCDHIRCTRCPMQFCYICGADWLLIYQNDNSSHARTCRHWRRPAAAEPADDATDDDMNEEIPD